ncbi:MAG: HD domain-containing protein [Candidatus Hydrogenedentes bacterium]|nr:HD domain-containing protein [Candidatus Hydrogenedentota bacterium]
MKRECLIVLSGPLAGAQIDIVGSLTIGRSPENSIQLNDLQVSRRHCVLQQTPNGTIIKDLGSGNGTFIGEQRILEYRLAEGDIIKVGPFSLRYQSAQGVAMTTPRPIAQRPPSERGSVRFDPSEMASKVQAASADNVYKTFFQMPAGVTSADQLKETQKRLQAVYESNQIISSERDLKKLFERVMAQIFKLVPAHNGVILLKDEKKGELIVEFVQQGEGQGEVAMSQSIVKRAFEQGEAIITYNAADDARFDAGASIIAQNITSAMCVPLTHQNARLGVIYVDTRGTRNAFAQTDLELLVALSGPAAIAIRNAQYLAKLHKSYQDTLIALANSIELRDHYTVGHTWRVTNFALEIARALGWTDDKLKECEMGGVLHDIGKISVDDAVLRKPGHLTDEEFEKMKVHPEKGARLLQDIEFLAPCIPYALYHHERFDGRGYPFGLKGEEIPIEGRLLAVADTFDAMTSNRPYRKGLDPNFAISELEKGKGTQFDPDVVDAMVRAYKEGKIDRLLQDYYKKEEKSIACPFCSTYLRLPEGVEAGHEFPCGVCHRQMKLLFANDMYYGELTARSERGPMHTPLPGVSPADTSAAPANAIK